MPTIAVFYGIVIRLYFGDHAPPHVHAIYGGAEALVTINPPGIMAGRLPRRAEAMVLEWVALRHTELLRAWNEAQRGRGPGKVAPLSEVMLYVVEEVRPCGAHQLNVRFRDGVEGLVDLSGLVGHGIFAALRDPATFARVSIDEFGAVTWPDGADLAPDAMYEALRRAGHWRPAWLLRLRRLDVARLRGKIVCGDHHVLPRGE